MKDDPKPFLDHLEDLRVTIVRIVATLAVFTVAAFVFVKPLLEIFYWPMRRVGMDPKEYLQVLGVADPFMFSLQVSFFSGLTIALPFMFYFLGQFVLPGLTSAERRMLWPTFALGTGLFVGGAAFCYFLILPTALEFFYQFGTELGFATRWSVQSYMEFVVQMLLAFGISFELPVVVLVLAKLGFVDSALLSHYRRHAVVGIVFLSAVVTPTSDLLTLSMMSVPMWVLFEVCVLICRGLEKKEAAAEEA